MQDKTPGLVEAQKVLEKHLSARAKALGHLERYVEGTQYDHLPDWFSDKKPLWERAPCIVYPIVKAAIDSNSDLLLGEGRFPSVRVDGLTGEEAETFEKAVDKVVQQARLKAAAREVFAAGQGCGSACAVFGVRGGRLFIDTVLARWCTPTFDSEEAGAVAELEIRYPYLALEKTPDGEKWVCKLYRRTISKTHDIQYAPATALPDGREPSWSVEREIPHGLGFCPVIWYAHLKGCAAVNDFDGRAIHEHLTDEIRAHDFALSQRHRAALYAGDPQWTEIGVEPGFNPTGNGGRKAEVQASVFGRPGETSTGAWVSEPANASKARKKSPGTVWQYPGKNPETKVSLHTLPGDALDAIDKHARDLRGKIAEALGVVFLDLEALPNESRLSGRALESAKARQLDRVNYYRADFGDKFLVSAIGMLLRIALVSGVRIPSLDIVQRVSEQSDLDWSWHSPPIDLAWGAYFLPSGDEEYLLMQAASLAKESGIATTRILVEKLRSVLGIKDVDAYMEELEAEKEEALEREQQVLAAEAQAKAAAAPKPTQKGSSE
jgi:hypothetical protein